MSDDINHQVGQLARASVQGEDEGFAYGVQTERFKRECQRLSAALDPVTASVLRDSGLDMSELRERLRRLRRRIDDFEHVMGASNQDDAPASRQDR